MSIKINSTKSKQQKFDERVMHYYPREYVLQAQSKNESLGKKISGQTDGWTDRQTKWRLGQQLDTL